MQPNDTQPSPTQLGQIAYAAFARAIGVKLPAWNELNLVSQERWVNPARAAVLALRKAAP